MASRQNKEARKEYPTGHNKGNDSPNRDVPGTNGGKVRTFGAPVGGPPPVRDTDEERRRLLETKPEPGESRRRIEEHEAGGREETRQRAEEEARNRRTAAPEEPSPTADLTITTAIDRIKKRQQDQAETDR